MMAVFTMATWTDGDGNTNFIFQLHLSASAGDRNSSAYHILVSILKGL
jgi:hypothetical protein